MSKKASLTSRSSLVFLGILALSVFSGQVVHATSHTCRRTVEVNDAPEPLEPQVPSTAVHVVNQKPTWTFLAGEFTASIAESASALNLGNTVNFTVTVTGGTAPFTYTWYIDDQLVQTGSSPTYSTNTQPVGPHHVYVTVTDSNGNTAQTLSPEFNVLSGSSYPPSSTSTPTQEPTSNAPLDSTLPIAAAAIALIILTLTLIAYSRWHKRK